MVISGRRDTASRMVPQRDLTFEPVTIVELKGMSDDLGVVLDGLCSISHTSRFISILTFPWVTELAYYLSQSMKLLSVKQTSDVHEAVPFVLLELVLGEHVSPFCR